MGREQWLKLPQVVRLLLVVGGLLLIFSVLSRLFPAPIDFVLAISILGLGLAYTWWEWGLIRRQKDDLEKQLRRERRDWQRGLPAHLRSPEKTARPSSAPAADNPPARPDEGPQP